MHITPNILSILPHISTTWDNIISLRTEDGNLIITLKCGEPVTIGELGIEDITTIFEAHASYTQKQHFELPNFLPNLPGPFTMSLPLNLGESSLATLGELHQNPNQEDLPPEILEKIAIVAKAFGLDEVTDHMPREPGCNCLYCQITKAEPKLDEEKISDEDLAFRDWEIVEMGENQYSVTNPIEKGEQFNVFLGNPIGCTCGAKNCEHIKAVLQS